MTTKRRNSRRATYRDGEKSQNDVVMTDNLWTWSKRLATATAAIGGILWYVFQFYSQVQGLKDKVDVLYAGQGTIMQSIADVKTSVSQIAQQTNTVQPAASQQPTKKK